jgi:hypothetical protein
MIDLGENPKPLLKSCDGTKFILEGRVLKLCCDKSTAYLYPDKDYSLDVLRDKVTNQALMSKQELVELIRSKQYVIS